MLNLHHLFIFHTVATAGGFTRAAEELYIGQPAVSRQVQELERALGLPLIDRVGRRVYLTDAGTALLAYTTPLFALVNDIEEEMADRRGLARGRLALGASSTLGMYVLPAILAAFRTRWPGVALQVVIANTQQIADSVLAHELDLGVVEGPVSDARLTVTPLTDDELVLVLPAGHALAGSASVDAADCRDLAFVLREAGSGTRVVADRYLRAANLEPAVALELGNSEAIKRAIAAGMGVGIMSLFAIADEVASGRLAVARLRGVRMTRQFTSLTLRERRVSRAARAFQEVLTTALTTASPGGGQSAPRIRGG